MTQIKTPEARLGLLKPGIPVLIVAILIFPGSTILWAILVAAFESVVAGILIPVSIITGILCYRCLVLVNPNQSKVLILFGKYVGSIRDDGFYAVNPFTVRRSISLRLHNFNSDTLKVNDKRGNPIEIGAVVVWKVKDTAQAAFDVEDFESFVSIQTDSALRHLAQSHPYDEHGETADETSLRGSSDVINAELMEELTERLSVAGIEVSEARLQHLAYAPEIASVMLQRQQADAIISARTRIVDGAVGMVKMALDKLKEQGVVELDEERKAAMTSNLLVVLCSERGTSPVVNAGTIH
jgi:regulator of protease activity HflC (stomatin/prohibitin superfamily)